jgi:hypothetical protein
LARTVIFDLRFTDWDALFGVLLNSVEKDRVGMKMESGSILKKLSEIGNPVETGVVEIILSVSIEFSSNEWF